MPPDSLPAALSLLRDEPNLAADAALLHALPHVAASVEAAIIDVLVERDHQQALAELVRMHRIAGSELRQAIALRAASLSTGIRAALDSNTLQHRESAIALIVDSDAGQLAYLLADALGANCPNTRKLAAAGLHTMADRLVSKMESERPASEFGIFGKNKRFVCEALAIGVQRWERHRQTCVIEAALWMGDSVEAALHKKLEEPRTQIVRVIGDLLERKPTPRLAGVWLRALSVDPLRSAAVRAITRCHDTDVTRALFSQAWLLADARIERGCRSLRDERWLASACHVASTLTGSDASGAVQLIAATGGSHDSKIEHLRSLLSYGTDDIRHAVLRSLSADSSDVATDMLASIAVQRMSPRLTAFATRETRRRSRRSRSTPTTSVNVTRSPPSSVPAFRTLWDAFEDPISERQSDALANASAPCADLPKHLRARLASLNPLDRVRALRIAQATKLVELLADDVRKLTQDDSAVVRCQTIALLRQLRSPTDMRLLLEAINDPNPRVQASAVEALDCLNHAGRRAATEPKLRSPHNRVRANAVKSLLRMELPAAGDSLLDMFDDPSPIHRISALWVAQTLKLQAVRDRVENLSRTDPNNWVRLRAESLLKQFEARKTTAQHVGVNP